MDLITQNQWNNSYKGHSFTKAKHNDQLRLLIQQYIPKGNGKAFEVGCYPGTYLCVFGDLGYELNGIDLAPGTESELVKWLQSQNYNIGEIANKDFNTVPDFIKFDIVASFGFIEHFKDYEREISKHLNLVAENGFIVLTTPNFRSKLNYFLHKLFNPHFLKHHNIEVMNPEKWKKIILNSGFKIIYSGYFGYFNFWVEKNENRNIVVNGLLKVFLFLLPLISRILPKNKLLSSPYCGLIAKRE